jgi:biopolymer transport protein TolQ
MATEPSLWMYFANASGVVKSVMSLLFVASLLSWTFIIERLLLLKYSRQQVEEFEQRFWNGTDLTKLYSELNKKDEANSGLASIFYAGFREFLRLRKQPQVGANVILESAQRAMRIAHARELDKLENHLAFLATVGSTSPYIGLFGTVWGIMTSFHALGQASQATIAMVAPGISEALIATAMGLFAAIPAVIAYNRYANDVERLQNHYETFQEEFASILHRQTLGSVSV